MLENATGIKSTFSETGRKFNINNRNDTFRFMAEILTVKFLHRALRKCYNVLNVWYDYTFENYSARGSLQRSKYDVFPCLRSIPESCTFLFGKITMYLSAFTRRRHVDRIRIATCILHERYILRCNAILVQLV